MKKLMFFLIVGLIVQSQLNAQASFAELENNKVVYPSPTAASLGKYGEYPVSLYNGLVNIGQDIVTVKSGHLTLNVSLSYHASGNRPSDIPGWVGLGFSLNAGGVITRVIKDLADDDTYGFYSANESGQYLFNNFPRSEFVDNYFNATVDPRSDVYQFNFCGKTGEFVFDWNRKIHFKQLLPFKIQEQYGPGGFAGFVVTTDDGTVYTFDQTERTRTGNVLTGRSPVTSWYLTKIQNLSGDNIALKYTAPMNKFRYKQYSTSREVAGVMQGGDLETGRTDNINTTADEVVYLDEIDFNDGKLFFGKSKRNDPVFMPAGITPENVEEKKLDLITLKDNNSNIVKQWKFDYIDNSTERLKLKDLIVQGSDQTDIQKYSFEYNIGRFPLPLPGPSPNVNPYLTNDVDYWGYYNGATNGDYKIPLTYSPEYNQYFGKANRSINPAFAKTEMLEKITYPTGGYTLFEYEPNDYSAQGASWAEAQNPLTITTGAGTESYVVSYNRDEGGFEEDPSTMSFTLTAPSHVHIIYSYGADGNLHSWAPQPGTTYESDVQMAAGTYSVQALLNTYKLLLPENADVTRARGEIDVYLPGSGDVIPIKAKTGPGLRIKSIVTNDGITSTTRSFEYRLQNSEFSSGFLSVFPAFYASLHAFALNLQGVCVTSEPLNDITDGTPVGYSRVVEHFQDNSSIEHIYTTYGDHPDELMEFSNMYTDARLAHMTSNDFWRGLETSTSYYNAGGVIQKLISNSYDVLPGSETDVQAIELKPTIAYSLTFFDGETPITIPPNYTNGTLISLYSVKSCFLYNSGSVEATFDKDGGNQISASITKHYDNVKHLQPTRVQTTGSDGSTLTTVTSFADDFAPGIPFVDYMQANHLTSLPVEQVVYKGKGGVNKIVSGNIITYKAQGAGLPEQLLKMESASPVQQASFKFSNSSVGALLPLSSPSPYNPDAHYQLALTFIKYDTKGNLLESVGRNGIKMTYLWGYGGEHPVAKIEGKSYADVVAQSGIDQAVLDNINNQYTEQQIRAELHKLYGLDGCLVNTYTYKPLTGTTSETDPTGRTTYYEYDTFGRLMIVRDQDQNILKKICYNYAGQPENCSVANANWQNTANTRCVVNAATTYNTGYQEQEQKDMNQQSPSYNQTRWTNVGMNITACPMNAWQSTGVTRCAQNVFLMNTGYQEEEQKDVNPASYGYNSRRWINPVLNTTACPLEVWQSVGTTRCALNASGLNTGDQEQEQKDINPSSPSYNSFRWANIGANVTACPMQVWQVTGNTRCVVNGNDENTGEQEQEQKDINPSSTTYNQTKWVSTGSNLSACPLPCSSMNCYGDDKRCINGVCETGMKVYTDTTEDPDAIPIGFICTYHYEWSNGEWSGDYYEHSSTRLECL